MTSVVQGQALTVEAAFYAYPGGPPVDVTGVTITIKTADGVTTVVAATAVGVTHPATGVYTYSWAVSSSQAAGDYLILWSGNAGAVTASEIVTVTAATTGLMTLTQIKKQLNIPLTDTGDDDELLQFGASVTQVIENHVGAVTQRTVTETFNGGRPALLLSTRPVLSITSVTDTGNVLASGDYSLNTEAGVLTRVSGVYPLPFLPGVNSVTVTYLVGTAAVAGNVLQAALIIMQHMWDTQRPAGGGPYAQGSDDYDPRYSYSIPRRALELLGEPIGGFA